MAIKFLNTVAVDTDVLYVDASSNRVGIGTTSPGAKLDVQGTQGQLFSVTDDLSGEIFAVSDISGVPIMTVNSSGVSYFDGNVGIGTQNPTTKLSLSDTTGISGTGNDTYGQIDLVNTETGASGDQIGPFITFRGKRGAVDTTIAAYGAIGAVNTGSTGNSTGALTFLVKNAVGAAEDLVEQMRIQTGGNVGIGETSPERKLVLNGELGTASLEIKKNNDRIVYLGTGSSSATADDSILHLMDQNVIKINLNTVGDSYLIGGNVGIGITAPVAKLDVLGTSGGPVVFDYAYTTNAGLRIHGDESAMDIVGTDSGNHASTILLRNGNEGFGLLNNPNLNTLQFRSFTATADAFSIHNTGGNLSSLVDILTLEKDGNVGIGTTNPAQNFVVADATNGNGVELVPGATATIQTYNRGTASYNNVNIDTASTRLRSTDYTSFHNGSGFPERMRITNNGNVGIGTTSPSQKLEVAGKLLVDNGNLGSVAGDTIYHAEITGQRHHLDFKEVRTANGSDWMNTTYKLQMRVDSTNHQSIDFVSDANAKEHIDIYTGNQVFNTRFDANGNVGIGTTSPGQKLHVAGGTIIDASISGQTLLLGRSNGQPSIKAQTDNGGHLILDSATNFMSLNHYVSQNIVMVAGGGNVGIGTTSPSEKLEVAGSVRIGNMKFEPSNAGRIGFNRNTTNGVIYNSNYAAHQINAATSTNGFFEIQSYTAAGVFQGSVAINAGNLGIGTTSPSQKLHVTGNARVTGAYYDSNNLPGTSGQVLSSTATGTDWIDGSAIPGVPGGSGTLNTIPLWTPDGDTLGNSHITQNTNDIFIPRYLGHTGDGNNYIGFPANDVFNITTAGVQRFRVNANGNVGIGTTSPGAKLEISHGGANNGLLLENTLNSSNYQIALNIRQNEGLIFQRWIGGIFNGNLMRIGYTGAIKFDAYDSTNNTGTPTYLLGTDASGNVVKTNTVPGSGAGPYLPLAGGTMTGNTIHNDNVKSIYGTSTDGLEIYHDGSDSIIADTGTGDLYIRGAASMRLQGINQSNFLIATQGGNVNLYYNNANKLNTSNTGVNVTGEISLNGNKALLSNQENTDIDSAAAETIAQVATASYTAAFFDFVVNNSALTSVRSGTVYACNDGTNVEFTETSTQDIGDTSDVVLSVDISGGQMRLRATVASDNWSVKSLIRAI